MTNIQEIENTLAHMTGSENWYKYPFFGRTIHLTDGVKYLCEACQCYWLIDLILSHQLSKRVRFEPFQTWHLKRAIDKDNVDFQAYATDGNGNRIASQDIPYSDFPLDSIDLYFTNNVLLLPSEN